MLLLGQRKKTSTPTGLIRKDWKSVSKKPDTVEFYDQTKSGVDVLDRKVRTFTARRKCRRWPYTFVMNLIDVAVCNAAYIFGEVHQVTQQEMKSMHRQFLINCGYQMVEQQLSRRASSPAAHQPGVKASLSILGYLDTTCEPTGDQELPFSLASPQRCAFCSREDDKKTRIGCCTCQRPMCAAHRSGKCAACSL